MKFPIIAICFWALTAASTQGERPARMPEDVAVYAVRQDGESLSIDPVVIVHYGSDQRFTTIPAFDSPLPSRDWTEADFDKLEESLYRPGTPVTLFSGGERIGATTVRSSNIEGRDGGCVDLSAVISYSGKRKPLLAANTTSEIQGHRSTRRAPTPAETSTLRQLAKDWLIEYGIDKDLLERGSLRPVLSTQLRQDAGRALIGRFDVVSKRAIHRLFAIAEQDGGRYRLTLTNLEVQHDVEDGTDKTEGEYLDQLDINNDGVDEVITRGSHYESWSYAVWEFEASHKIWRRAYTGAGGGC